MNLRFYVVLFSGLFLGVGARSQEVAIKSNLLYDATATVNLGLEFRLAPKWTLDVSGNYNGWTFSENRKWKHWLVQPEARYWFCRKFEGHFIGMHGHYGHFNIGQLPFISGLKEYTLRGDLYGGGVSYGYHWAFGERWGIEAMIGAGYAYMKYDKLRCAECGEREGSYTRTYFGPTRIGISFIYFLR